MLVGVILSLSWLRHSLDSTKAKTRRIRFFSENAPCLTPSEFGKHVIQSRIVSLHFDLNRMKPHLSPGYDSDEDIPRPESSSHPVCSKSWHDNSMIQLTSGYWYWNSKISWSRNNFTLELLDTTSKWPENYWTIVLSSLIVIVCWCWSSSNAFLKLLWIDLTLFFLAGS